MVKTLQLLHGQSGVFLGAPVGLFQRAEDSKVGGSVSIVVELSSLLLDVGRNSEGLQRVLKALNSANSPASVYPNRFKSSHLNLHGVPGSQSDNSVK